MLSQKLMSPGFTKAFKAGQPLVKESQRSPIEGTLALPAPSCPPSPASLLRKDEMQQPVGSWNAFAGCG